MHRLRLSASRPDHQSARRAPHAGGSSSGSAAAVAAGFAAFAFGTQTAGSTIRPASYCGVVGFKPSFGLLPTQGIAAISTTLDHVGVFAASPRDAWYLVSALVLPHADVLAARRPRRVLLPRLPAELPQEDAYPDHLATLADLLREDGITVGTAELPIPAAILAACSRRSATGRQRASCWRPDGCGCCRSWWRCSAATSTAT